MAETNNLTRKWLEQTLLKQIQDVYLTHLGHQIDHLSCKLVDKNLTIIIEDSITKPEQFLFDNGQQELAQKVRSQLHLAIEPRLKSLIEELVQIPVVDLLYDSRLDTRRTSLIAVLATVPDLNEI